MRILIAPDKFKGTLTQREACAAIRRGIERAAKERGIEVEIDECPVADGGEGTIEAIRAAIPMWVECAAIVPGPIPERMTAAEWGMWLGTDGQSTAVLESFRAVGLHLIEPHERDPERMSSFGLGAMINAAVHAHCPRVLIALGGSATVDGGIGMAQALGWGSFDEDPRARTVLTGRAIATLTGLPTPAWTRTAERKGVQFIALCDVQNPLLGPRGAARMFGPQKGATPEQVERLERGLENLVRVCRECGIPCDPDQPGAGAAGGLGFGLATFLGAKLVPGAPFILDLLNFDQRCAAADLVITGEGKMDMQTAEGKACAEVARRAANTAKPCIAIVGTTDEEPETLRLALARRGVALHSIRRASKDARATDSPAGALEEATHAALLEFLPSR